MYADSRPYPWDSHTSSGPVNRTSTGNCTLNGSPSMIRRSADSTSGRAARGMAYSISTKRTRRGEQKTRSDRSV